MGHIDDQFEVVRQLYLDKRFNFPANALFEFKDRSKKLSELAYPHASPDRENLQKDLAYFLWDHTERPEGLSDGFWVAAGNMINNWYRELEAWGSRY